MTHLSDEELVLLYYGEPGVSGEHLRSCAGCREASASLRRTLDACSEWEAPEVEEHFGRTAWVRLVPGLYEEKAGGWLSLNWQAALAAAVMVVMLIVAFTAGRITKPAITAGLSKQARERILEISVADHLDRAGMLLTEISNVSYTGPGEFEPERARAQDLVEEGRLMRQVLSSQGQTATLSLLDDVERFLAEVANSPDAITSEEIRGLQRRVSAGSLIFKVRVMETNLRSEGQKS